MAAVAKGKRAATARRALEGPMPSSSQRDTERSGALACHKLRRDLSADPAVG